MRNSSSVKALKTKTAPINRKREFISFICIKSDKQT